MEKINGVSYASITKFIGRTKNELFRFAGRSKPTAVIPSLVTTNLVFNVDASDTDNYNSDSITDSVGSVRGDLSNGAYVDTTAHGGMIYTDGANDEVRWAARSPLLFNSGADKTLQAWVKIANSEVNYWVVADMGPSRDRGHYVRILGGKVMFGGSRDGANTYRWQITQDQEISQNTPTLITVVHRVEAPEVEFYINDTLVSQEGYPRYGGVYSSYNDSRAANTTTGIYYNRALPYEGRMGQMLVYDKALSQAEITQNYNATKARFGL